MSHEFVDLKIKLPAELKEALHAVSIVTGLSESDLILIALVEYLSKPGRTARDDGMGSGIVRDEKYLH
ncbi:MAG: CopG family transcriptional regulator [Bacillota bacterium]